MLLAQLLQETAAPMNHCQLLHAATLQNYCLPVSHRRFTVALSPNHALVQYC